MADSLLDRVVAISRDADAYPASLVDLAESPSRLRVVGALPDFSRAVAIVGTRRASQEALDFAHELAHVLAQRGVVVVSGGALGIDAAAHEGALDAGGVTVAVLPTDFHEPYPKRNRPLFQKIAETGCLLTEADETWQPHRFTFLHRNRIVAALARVTVVVQAPARSGALSTARHATKVGRPVLVVPSSPWDGRAAGGLKLLREGAQICATPHDVLSVLALGDRSDGPAPSTGLPSAQIPLNLENGRKQNDYSGFEPSEAAIMKVLDRQQCDPDTLCRMTGIPALAIQRSILRLLMEGLIEERPGGRYRGCHLATKT